MKVSLPGGLSIVIKDSEAKVLICICGDDSEGLLEGCKQATVRIFDTAIMDEGRRHKRSSSAPLGNYSGDFYKANHMIIDGMGQVHRYGCACVRI